MTDDILLFIQSLPPTWSYLCCVARGFAYSVWFNLLVAFDYFDEHCTGEYGELPAIRHCDGVLPVSQVLRLEDSAQNCLGQLALCRCDRCCATLNSLWQRGPNSRHWSPRGPRPVSPKV